MLNLNGLYVNPEALLSALPTDDAVHISLANGAMFDVPVPEGKTPAAFANDIAYAVENGDTSAVYETVPFEPQTITQTDLDNAAEKAHASGWFAALRESKLQIMNGTFDVFFDEQMRGPEQLLPSTPDHQRFQDPAPLFDMPEPKTEVSDGGGRIDFGVLAHKVADSGEPMLEAEPLDNNRTRPIVNGNVTLAYEEYQSGLDDAYERGRNDGVVIAHTSARQTTSGTLDRIVQEIIVDDGAAVSRYKFAEMLATRLGYTVVS